MKLINAAFAIGVFLSLMPPTSIAADTPLREKVSISVTNKYGDVFTNLVVAKVLSDGLVLEHNAGQLKLKYSELPQDVREKYEPLTAAAESKERQATAQNAAFIANERRAQAEQSRLRVAREKQSSGQPNASLGKLRIGIPNEGWGISVLNTGFRELGKQLNDAQFVYQASGQNGFNLSIFVERPSSGGVENSDVFKFYWPKASRNPLIDEKSIKVETREKFVKVSYTTLDIPNVNYYFAFKGRWVDVHISKYASSKADGRLFNEFDVALSYGD